MSSSKSVVFVLVLILGTTLVSGGQAQSLRQAADHAGILIGSAVRPEHFSEQAYAATLAREFNMVEPEDAMKWLVIRPGIRTFDFSAADRIVAFARVHQMKVRGHNLVWGTHNPQWLTEGHFTEKELWELLRQHITKVVGHYRGQVFAWDVVNEALDEKGSLRSSIWYDQPGIGLAGKGTAYIEQVFRWARAADPKALLFYNEAEGEGLNVKSDAIYAMVRDFKRRRVPIDGVGLQMHISDSNPDTAAISTNIGRLVALGVQVHITEADVALPVDENRALKTPEDLNRQAQIYRDIVRACLDHPGCTAFQTWGFTDKYSWIFHSSGQTRGAALLFDQNYQPKPAYAGVKDALAKGRKPVP